MKCSICGNIGDKNDKEKFSKNGFILLSGKKKIQKYRCKNCYSTTKENTL